MRCLILGGTGLIGSHTCIEMARQGCRIRVLGRGPRPWTPLPVGTDTVWGNWEDREVLERALTGIDLVIHLVSSVWPQRPGRESEADLSARDLSANGRLLARCADKGVKKMVFLSSGGTVYGFPGQLPIKETCPPAPISRYGRLKLAMEEQIRSACRGSGLRWLILRGGNAFGEYHNPSRNQGAVNVFLRRIRQNLPLEIWGSTQTVRDYLYAGEMARAIRHTALSGAVNGVFNLGSGRGTSLGDLLEIIFAVTGKRPRVIYRSARCDDVSCNVLDIGKIGRELGWHPETSLETGIRKTWDWICQQETGA